MRRRREAPAFEEALLRRGLPRLWPRRPMHVNNPPPSRRAPKDHALCSPSLDHLIATPRAREPFAGDPGQAAARLAGAPQHRFLRGLGERRVRGQVLGGIDRLGRLSRPRFEDQHVVGEESGSLRGFTGPQSGMKRVDRRGRSRRGPRKVGAGDDRIRRRRVVGGCRRQPAKGGKCKRKQQARRSFHYGHPSCGC
jgi:hypothetical protein